MSAVWISGLASTNHLRDARAALDISDFGLWRHVDDFDGTPGRRRLTRVIRTLLRVINRYGSQPFGIHLNSCLDHERRTLMTLCTGLW